MKTGDVYVSKNNLPYIAVVSKIFIDEGRDFCNVKILSHPIYSNQNHLVSEIHRFFDFSQKLTDEYLIKSIIE